MTTSADSAAAAVHHGLDQLLTLLRDATPGALTDVLQAAGGPGEQSIAAHLARVLDTVHEQLQQAQAEAAEWIEQARDDLVDRVAGDAIERALSLLP